MKFQKKSLNPWISNNFIQKVSPTDKVTSRDADASKKSRGKHKNSSREGGFSDLNYYSKHFVVRM